MNLCGERGDADKNDPEFLKALNDLGSIIDQYDPSCVYNMDEPGLFFWLLFRYTVLLPTKGVSTVGAKRRRKIG
jgi:hypothetical protein